MNKVYEVDDGERHWIVASSPKEALRILYSPVSETIEEYMKEMCLDEEPDVEQLHPDLILSIRLDDLPSSIYKEIASEAGTGISIEVHASGRVRDWARQEPGIIGSTLY